VSHTAVTWSGDKVEILVPCPNIGKQSLENREKVKIICVNTWKQRAMLLFNALLSTTLNVCFTFNVKEKVSNPYNILGRSMYGSTVLCWTLAAFFSFLILYKVGRTPWTGDQPVARPLHTHRTIQTQNKYTQTFMP
jgi:hypothetical protein